MKKSLIILSLITLVSVNSDIYSYIASIDNKLNTGVWLHLKRGAINEVRDFEPGNRKAKIDTKDAWCSTGIEVDPVGGKGKFIDFHGLKCNNFEVDITGTKDNFEVYIKDL